MWCGAGRTETPVRGLAASRHGRTRTGARVRTPTRNQYDKMLPLASGSAGLSRTKGQTDPLLHHGWVTAEWRPPYYQFVRLTPDGYRALALAVEKFGLPGLAPSSEPSVLRRVCGDCGSGTYRYVEVSADEAMRTPRLRRRTLRAEPRLPGGRNSERERP